MIFLTVGSALPFDRMVRLIDKANKLGMFDQSVFAQIGSGSYLPDSLEYTDFLSHSEYMQALSESHALISHAGIGSISAALKAEKPMLVMPRRKLHGELVDDHQALTAQKFSELGHVLAFETLKELQSGLRALPKFKPKPRTPAREGISEEIQIFVDSNFVAKSSEEIRP